MAEEAIPLAAASVLKSASHASKLPVPQDAASTGAAGDVRTALTAKILSRERRVIGAVGTGIASLLSDDRQSRMSGETAAKTRLR
jgi:hypothetical protein